MPPRGPRYDTDGPVVAEWLKRSVRFTDGPYAAQPFVVEDFQGDFLNEAFLVDPKTGLRVYNQAWFCLPKKNGKTQLGGGLSLYGMAGDGRVHDDGEFRLERNPEVIIAAAARKQAGQLGNTARAMALASPSLQRRLEINKHDLFATRDGGGRLHWIASDADTIQGIKPSFSLVDELGSHKSEYVYSTIISSGLGRAQPFNLVISHVGLERYGIFGLVYDQIKAHPKLEVYGGKGRNGRMRKGPALMVLRDRENGFLCYWYGIGDRDDLDPEDPRVWEACNPASWVTVDELSKIKNAPSMKAMPSNFPRWHCNMWVVGADAFLPAGAWQACGNEDLVIPAGAPVFLGLDGAKKHDHGAIAICWPDLSDGRNRPLYRIIVKLYRAADSETSIVGRMANDVRRLDRRYVIHEAHYDPHFLTESADALEDEGIEMLEFPQTPGRMGVATSKFREHVVEGLVEHDADPEVAQHVANAVTVEAGETMWRVSKRKTSGKIDGLVAMMLALDGAENAFKRGDIGPGRQVQIIS